MQDAVVFLSVFILIFACVLVINVFFRKIFCTVTIYEYEKGLKYYKGRFIGILEPGKYRVFTPNTSIEKIDIRPAFMSISGQELLTLDGISIKVSAALNYKVADPYKAFHEVDNYSQALYLIVQLALREAVGSLKLDEILEKRNELNERLKELATDKAAKIGIEFYNVNIKDIVLNSELKKAYIKAAAAQKEGMASLEKARSEAATMRSLANTAKMLENNPSLFKLRLLQSIDSTSGNTIVIKVSDDDLKLEKEEQKL